jgi:3-hydroxyisobutyrate dehydrogenase-like beta-hydroxyacid dehydrogenase
VNGRFRWKSPTGVGSYGVSGTRTQAIDTEKVGERMQETVGFIGLGDMGEGMARNVLKIAHRLVVYDLSQEPVDRLVTCGATAAEDLRDLASRSQWIVLVLPDADVVRSVVLGDSGLFEHLADGHILVDCGTTHPVATREIWSEVQKNGAHLIDAPVSGMKARAEDGSLTIMAGGDEEAFRTVSPLLETMASDVTYMGEPGNGQLTKMVNNVLFNISIAAMSELLPFAIRLGLDPEKVCKVVGTGSGQSYGFDHFSRLALLRDFESGYAMESARKDMDTVLDLAQKEGAQLPLAESTMETYKEALRRGFGQENKAAMVKVCEEMLGVVVESRRDDED